MRNYKLVLGVMLIALMSMNCLQAQTYIDDTTIQAQTLIEQEIDLNIQDRPTTIQNGVLLGSGVFLTQIGDNNTVDLEVKGAALNGSASIITQLGNSNDLNLSLTGDSFLINSVQQGNNHSIQGSNALRLSESVTTEINQLGNGQSLIIEGQNSISNSMQINMSGQGQEVIVRSFN